MGSYTFREKPLTSEIPVRQYAITVAKTADELTLQGLAISKSDSVFFWLKFANNPLNNQLTVSLDRLLLNKDTLLDVFSATESQHLARLNKVKFRFTTTIDEHPYGFGEQFSNLSCKGKLIPVFTEEQGIGRGDAGISGFTKMVGAGGSEFSTYCGMPYFITNKNRAFLFNEKVRSIFDFTNDTLAEFSGHLSSFGFIIFTGSSPKAVLENFTAETGRMPELPDWAYGTWLGLQGGKAKCLQIVEDALKAGNPISALWIQDWEGRRKTRFGSQLFWNWQHDTILYPHLPQLCEDLNQKGIKTLGYINSFLANEGPLVAEAKAKNYLVKTTLGEDYKLETAGFPAYLVDLYNPEAYIWLKEIIKTNLIGVGLSGWMADFGEWYPMDAKGKKPELHNSFPVLWAKLNREAIKEAGKEKELVFFTRSGYTGSAAYSTLFWAGDQLVSWGKNDGLPSALTAILSSGLSGITLNHSDIGGYTTITYPLLRYTRSRELFYRWAEMAVFMPIFRTHEGLKPGKNFQFYADAEGQTFFAKMGRLHHFLKPYFKALVKEACTNGIPPVRAMWLEFPDDANALKLNTQFMLGSDLLVIPIMKPNSKTAMGYFPHGTWKHWNTGEIVQGAGDWQTFTAPIGTPAAYIKVGGKWEMVLSEILKDFK